MKLFHLTPLKSRLQIYKFKMDLKLVIVGTFCLLVNQSQALDWERDGNQFDVEESDLQARKLKITYT